MFAAAADDKDAYEQATMLHAQGLGRELEGNKTEALRLLRQAGALAPTDEVINFDLARLSFELKDPDMANDVKNFLALQPQTHDERVLRAYLLSSGGNLDAALKELQNTSIPPDSEALALQRILQRQMSEVVPPQEPGVVTARVLASIEYDSNVQVLPETDTSDSQGARVNVDGAVQWNPVRGKSELHVTGTLRTGTNLNNRGKLQQYDTESGALLVGGTLRPGPWTLYGDVEGTMIFISDFQDQYLRQIIVDLLALYDLAPCHLGLYGYGGGRTFVWANPNGQPLDRSGPLGEAGVVFDVTSGAWFVQARAGYQSEMASGSQLKERGPSVLLTGAYTREKLNAMVGLSYQYRDYWESSGPHRLDNRLVPTARLTWAFTPTWHAVASYAYFYNHSPSPYPYKRQLANLGVEAQW